MKRYEQLLATRTLKRKALAGRIWSRIHRELDARRISHRLFGSLKTGDFRAHSDIDILIDDDLDALSRIAVGRIITEASRGTGIDVDLIFKSDISEADIKRLNVI